MTRHLILLSAAALALAACGQSEINPPTDPAAPINTPDAAVPPAPAPRPGVEPMLPGAGPASFVGRWAADVAWCASPQGAQRPIEITTTRFEGYENRCEIATIKQVVNGYEAALSCTAEGQTSNERVRMSVQDDAMRLTWLDRNNAVVSLVRCPAETVSVS